MNSPWNKDWLEAQRQYVDVLASLAKTAAQKKNEGAQIPDWQKTLDNWWQTSLHVIPEDSQVVFSDLLQHSHSWYGITEQFNELLGSISANDDAISDWQTVLADQVDKMKSRLEDDFAGTHSYIWQGGMQSPLQGWQNMINAMSTGMGAGSPGFYFTDLQASIEKYFACSGLGHNQQNQDQIREGLRLWQVYLNNYQAYRQTLGNIALSALDRLHEKILTLADKKKSISCVRDLYDLWVDSHEEAYFTHVQTEEYSKLYGRVINSLLAFRAHSQKFLSDISKELNLPTTDNLNALSQEVRDIKKQQEQDKKRIKLLEEKIKQLNGDSSTPAGSSSSKKKKARKKQNNNE